MVDGSFCKSAPLPGSKALGLSLRRAGERTGGKAEDAPTATAKGVSGWRMSPTRQSAMNGFENRQSAPDWTLVALMTNRGVSGRSCKVAWPKRWCS